MGAGGSRVSRRAALGLGIGALAWSRFGDAGTAAAPPRIDGAASEFRTAHRVAAPPPPRTWRTITAGRSLEGRPVIAWHSPAPDRERRKVAVISGIHGDERIMWPLADALAYARLPRDVTAWIIPSANPDGWFHDERENAAGIDLNRNFPFAWRRSTGGPAPASAPETRTLIDFVTTAQPDLVLWAHQPLGYIGPIGETPVEYADSWTKHTGGTVRLGVEQHGGGETWCALVAGIPSVLIEVGGQEIVPTLLEGHRGGFEACVARLRPR